MTYEITTSHFRFYVRAVETNENVGFFRSLKEAVEAYPTATVNVPESIKKAYGIS